MLELMRESDHTREVLNVDLDWRMVSSWVMALIIDSTRIVILFNWNEITSEDRGNWTQHWIYRMGLKGNHGMQRSSRR